MKRVYVCSPLGGDMAQNLKKVKQYTRFVLLCGAAPVVSHFYALCLDDNVPEERSIGMRAGKSLLWLCDEMWVFGGNITAGMQEEINYCRNLNIRIRCITEQELERAKQSRVSTEQLMEENCSYLQL